MRTLACLLVGAIALFAGILRCREYAHANGGEHFFNFDGLRRYKSKFDPVWVSKYLASPGGLVLPRVLLDVSVLISGGVKELFVK